MSIENRKNAWGVYIWTYCIGGFMVLFGLNIFTQPVSEPSPILIISLISGIVIIIISTYKAEIRYRKIQQHD